jgi:hypothetical protein
MRALSASEVLRIWEQGSARSLLDRALLLLGRAEPDADWNALAALPIAARDRRLAELRAATFGEPMPLSARCPACEEALEFSITAEQIGWGERVSDERWLAPLEVRHGDALVRYRLPSSIDVARAAAEESDDAEGRLIEACIVEAVVNGDSVPASALPEAARASVAAAIAAADPEGDVSLDLGCPACGERWSMLFDIVTVFWLELSQRAKRLLQEVDALARVYGWREADVLCLTAQRRAIYVEMALT